MSQDDNYYEPGLAVDCYDAFYAQTLPRSPVAGDVDFYLARAREQGPRVLELAVGTGRIAVPLAEAGFEVTGLDLSTAMLERAAQRLAARGLSERVRLVQGDMSSFALAQRFDFAIIAFRSFHHVASAAGQRRTLETVRAHLRPGGLLALDIFDADLSTVTPGAASPARPAEATDPETGLRVRRTSVGRDNDPVAQTIREHVRIEAFDAMGNLVREQKAAFTFRWATHNEMACMLELAGFVDLQCFGDFQGGPHGYKREQIWLARNP